MSGISGREKNKDEVIQKLFICLGDAVH